MTLDTRNLEPKENYTNRSEMLYKTNTNFDTGNIDLESQQNNGNNEYIIKCLEQEHQNRIKQEGDNNNTTLSILCCRLFKNCFKLCCVCNFIIIFFSIIISLYLFPLILGIVSLDFNEKHKNEMDCNNNFIEPYVWLLVYSIINIVLFVIQFIIDINSYKSYFYLYKFVINLILLIVGSISFWNSCENSMPKSMNKLFYVNLIIGYILLFIKFKFIKKSKNNNNNDNENDNEKQNEEENINVNDNDNDKSLIEKINIFYTITISYGK